MSDESDAPATPRRIDPRAYLVIAIALGFLIAYFRLHGRLWWCKCGEPFLVSLDINSMHNSQHIIDPYSLSHVLHGVIFYFAVTLLAPKMLLSWRVAIATLVEIGWEILENSPIIIERYRAATISLGYEGDTVANSISDVAMAMIGFFLAAKIGWKWSLVFFVASELFMLWWIRDNLTLNVLMLVHPLQAVKQWQAGLSALLPLS